MHNFTLENLIAYHYNEVSEETSAAIKEALLADNQLKEQYKELLSAINSLDPAQYNPNSESMRDITFYAKKLMEELHIH
jgi:hypothetical protein